MRNFRKLSSEWVWDSGSIAAGLLAILAVAGVVLWSLPSAKTQVASKSFETENVGMSRSGISVRSDTTGPR